MSMPFISFFPFDRSHGCRPGTSSTSPSFSFTKLLTPTSPTSSPLPSTWIWRSVVPSHATLSTADVQGGLNLLGCHPLLFPNLLPACSADEGDLHHGSMSHDLIRPYTLNNVPSSLFGSPSCNMSQSRALSTSSHRCADILHHPRPPV